MSEQPSLLHQIQHTYQELHADGHEMLAARLELAQLELRLSSQRATRLGILVGVCLLFAAAGFVILVHLAAEQMPAMFGLSQTATVGILGGLLFVLGLGISGLAIRRFLQKHRHFEQTVAEFRTDIQALNEWFSREKSSG